MERGWNTVGGRRLQFVLRSQCTNGLPLLTDLPGESEVVLGKIPLRVQLACHRADVRVAEGRMPMLPHNRLLRLCQWLWAGPPCPVGHILEDGDEVAGFRVVHAPGHSMFFRDSDRLCIAGDVLANMNFLTGKPRPREPNPCNPNFSSPRRICRWHSCFCE